MLSGEEYYNRQTIVVNVVGILIKHSKYITCIMIYPRSRGNTKIIMLHAFVKSVTNFHINSYYKVGNRLL